MPNKKRAFAGQDFYSIGVLNRYEGMSVFVLQKPTVSQIDIQNIISIRNRLARTKKLLRQVEESVLLRLVQGSEVEDGIHEAWINTHVAGRHRRQKLKVR